MTASRILEIVVDIAALDTGVVDDIAERRPGVTALVEKRLGGFDNFAPGLSAITGHGYIAVLRVTPAFQITLYTPDLKRNGTYLSSKPCHCEERSDRQSPNDGV